MTDESTDATPSPDDEASFDQASFDQADSDQPGSGADEFGAVDYEAVEQQLAEARERLSSAPAQLIVTNHAMGLYELGAIHLSSAPPKLDEASLAIDAFAALVDGLGDRLGPEASTMRDALASIRMAFVQVKSGINGQN